MISYHIMLHGVIQYTISYVEPKLAAPTKSWIKLTPFRTGFECLTQGLGLPMRRWDRRHHHCYQHRRQVSFNQECMLGGWPTWHLPDVAKPRSRFKATKSNHMFLASISFGVGVGMGMDTQGRRRGAHVVVYTRYVATIIILCPSALVGGSEQLRITPCTRSVHLHAHASAAHRTSPPLVRHRLNGYLVLQGNTHLRTADFRHFP